MAKAPARVLEACACGGHAAGSSVCACPGPPAAAAAAAAAASAAVAARSAEAPPFSVALSSSPRGGSGGSQLAPPAAAVIDAGGRGGGEEGGNGSRHFVARFEEWEEWNEADTPLWKHAAAGSCAGVMEHLGMYPLDTVKTHMQALRPEGGPRPGIVEVVRSIARDGGGFGFMRGCSAIATGCVPAHIALFTSYEWTKKRLLVQGGEHEPMRAALCGAAATVCHDTIITPMDVVKQRMQLGVHRDIGDCLRHVCRREGIGSLYRSMPTTLAMNVPFGGVLVASNESIKLSLGLGGGSGSGSRGEALRSELPWYFLSAGLSGALASGATHPLDVIKTRLQTQDVMAQTPPWSSSSSSSSSSAGRLRPADITSSRASCAATAAEGAGAAAARAEAFAVAAPSPGISSLTPKYSGFVSAVSTMIREEGWHAFTRGMLPRMLHAVPAAAMCWGTYETVKSWL
mmetsp:Transcript_131527/g.420757  ORF Transcript_131527/g.420757 Transcript_131527/m.420757 type:complete len:458 (+) Transcript_131527:92-1465(+)